MHFFLSREAFIVRETLHSSTTIRKKLNRSYQVFNVYVGVCQATKTRVYGEGRGGGWNENVSCLVCILVAAAVVGCSVVERRRAALASGETADDKSNHCLSKPSALVKRKGYLHYTMSFLKAIKNARTHKKSSFFFIVFVGKPTLCRAYILKSQKSHGVS